MTPIYLPAVALAAAGCRASFREAFKLTRARTGDYAGGIDLEVAWLDDVWSDGTGAGQFDLLFSDIGATLTTGNTRSLDHPSLTLDDGSTGTMVEVRAILFRPRDYALSIGKGGTNGWTGLGAAWIFAPAAGTWTRLICRTDGGLGSTDATHKTIDIVNASGSTATYDLIVLGTTA